MAAGVAFAQVLETLSPEPQDGGTPMIVEHALIPVRPGEEAEFERAFAAARKLIESSPGFLGLTLSRGTETPVTHLLIVQWEDTKTKAAGFTISPAFREWSALMHDSHQPFPVVEHFSFIA
jgi:heme-degrading monooxygenase HmoA